MILQSRTEVCIIDAVIMYNTLICRVHLIFLEDQSVLFRTYCSEVSWHAKYVCLKQQKEYHLLPVDMHNYEVC